jgi:hypothetical protein
VWKTEVPEVVHDPMDVDADLMAANAPMSDTTTKQRDAP